MNPRYYNFWYFNPVLCFLRNVYNSQRWPRIAGKLMEDWLTEKNLREQTERQVTNLKRDISQRDSKIRELEAHKQVLDRVKTMLNDGNTLRSKNTFEPALTGADLNLVSDRPKKPIGYRQHMHGEVTIKGVHPTTTSPWEASGAIF